MEIRLSARTTAPTLWTIVIDCADDQAGTMVTARTTMTANASTPVAASAGRRGTRREMLRTAVMVSKASLAYSRCSHAPGSALVREVKD